MKKSSFATALLLVIVSALFLSSCKKDDEPKEDVSAIKKGWVTGTWKQKDITLGVDVSITLPAPYGKVTIKAGSSMLDDPIIDLLGVADFFKPTRNNTYTFKGDETYQIDGDVALILPVAGTTGSWKLEVYNAVLAFFPSSEKRDPHWINALNASKLTLALTVKIPGLGDAPLNLLLEKQ